EMQGTDDSTRSLVCLLSKRKRISEVEEFSRRFEEAAKVVDAKMRGLYEATGDMRYALTLLAATAYGIFYDVIDLNRSSIDDKKYGKIIDRGDEALGFLFEIQDRLKNKVASRREDDVIGAAFEQIRREHEKNRSLPMHTKKREDAKLLANLSIGVE